MAETRVDLLHLLEDLRDAYPGSIEETILTEIIANSLDSGATRIRITADPASASLTILDNGSGMPRKDLRRFHDLAASSKQRGQGIGFAGVGIKLALLACKEVVTESRRGRVHVATSWHLASRHRAPWRWVPPPGMVAERGTAVRLALNDALSPLTDRGFIEAALRRHYQALLDPGCTDMLKLHYPDAIMFEVNGALLDRKPCSAPEIAAVAIRMGRKRKPSAAGYLFRETASLGEDERGVAVSTYGKVIKRGWDWLGVSPAAPERIGGLIEFPALAGALTLNKGDFIRTGPRGALYLAARKAIQEVVTRQLAAWGDSREEAEAPRPRAMRSLERDLERVLLELAEGFPLLASLVEQRRGGQKRLALAPSPDLGIGAGPGAATDRGDARAACPNRFRRSPDAQRSRRRRKRSRRHRRPRMMRTRRRMASDCPNRKRSRARSGWGSRCSSRSGPATWSSRAWWNRRSSSTGRIRRTSARRRHAPRVTTSRCRSRWRSRRSPSSRRRNTASSRPSSPGGARPSRARAPAGDDRESGKPEG